MAPTDWLRYALAVTAAVAGAASSSRLASNNLQQHGRHSWQRFVRSPDSNIVRPAGIISHETVGNVSNPDGMIDGKWPTVLTRSNVNSTPPTVVVDFGQNVVGILTINFAGSHNISEGFPGIRLAFSETMEHLKDRSDFTRSDNAAGIRYNEPLRFNYNVHVVTFPIYADMRVPGDLHGCQHGRQVCSDGLHGFRYLKIWLGALESDAPFTSAAGSIAISSLSLQWAAYLGTADTFTGWFECSDEKLTQWWFDGVYTVDLGTNLFLANEAEPRRASSPTLEGKEVLFDGAKRDRDPYLGDLAVASLTSYLSHNFSESTRNVLEDLALHQRADGWIPPASINNYTLPLFDYPLWWVICSVDLVMYTGDTPYAATYWNVLVKTLDEYYPQYMSNSTKLLVKAAEMGYGDYAFLPRSGPVTYYTALLVHALSYAAQLASYLGHKDEANRWTARAAEVGSALMKHNFDASVGAFYDGGPCPDAPAGTYCNVHAQDGNSIAVLAGITDKNVSSRILDYWAKAAARPYGNAFYDSSVLSPGDHFSDRVYAFISYFELAARLSTPGAAASAFDEIRRLYGWMSSHDPKITMWEGIGPNGTAYQGAFTSMAHGWSTGIVPLMTNHVLGVKPLEPGFNKWQVCPVMGGGGLSWARGVVPTPNGGLHVSWARRETHAGSVFLLEVKAPEGTTGIICVPTIGFASGKVKLDGREVSKSSSSAPQGWNGDHGSIVAISVDGGDHSITVGI
ncbi:hypothetical protein TOPH_06120 [Tolypocladium ophioglossoides CBS 100239]|uniref:Alpha-L-rhamnosidase n=1 Tax=Tolypocladium ophioglossoides (strain CBS 100239) TaxID=1163406 RepID=A0A0L0N591_TOLOC|nr:hypothetical protein TOPH_06120 [Tolypocladium ophioglossoides CBS 100239]